jgi:N-acetyl-gamma-glutamylphosphate reductase
MLGLAWKLLLAAQLLLSPLLQLQMLTMPSEVAATSCSGLRGAAAATQRVIIIVHHFN